MPPSLRHQCLDLDRARASASVSTRGPSAVTRTSSSVRMPMPRHFAGTLLSSGATYKARLDGEHHARLEQA
jgi:hypothetical protein